MRAQKVLAKEFQFYFQDLDNIILVECHENETVTVRASRNNVAEERKVFFIRKLAAEGFISDDYQWFSGPTDGSKGVLWIKDYSWLKTHKPSARRTNRIMCSLLVAGCILWIAMMRVLIVSHDNTAKLKAKTPDVIAMSDAPKPPPPPAKSFVP